MSDQYLQSVADNAILNHGACPQCTSDGLIVWHTPEECKRLRLEDLAHAAIRAGLSK